VAGQTPAGVGGAADWGVARNEVRAQGAEDVYGGGSLAPRHKTAFKLFCLTFYCPLSLIKEGNELAAAFFA
jgi:hypothetical protein